MDDKKQIKKIVIIGPESTGKSTLCAELAAHYQTAWVREYAREYLEKNGTDYGFEDLYKIAEGQLDAEDHRPPTTDHRSAPETEGSPNPQLLFIDTNLYVIKVWSEYVFNKIDNRILTGIAKRKYDLYLLCDVDLPWVKDELREYPDLHTRKKLFHYYKEEMAEQNIPWVIISGNYDERLKKSIKAVDHFIS